MGNHMGTSTRGGVIWPQRMGFEELCPAAGLKYVRTACMHAYLHGRPPISCMRAYASGMQIKPAGANVPKSHRAGPNHVASCACALILAHGLAASGRRASTSYSLAAHMHHACACMQAACKSSRPGQTCPNPIGRGQITSPHVHMCPCSCPWIGRIRPAGSH